MSSPVRTSASGASTVGQQQCAGSSSSSAGGLLLGDDPSLHFPTDLICAQEGKEEALAVLKADLMSSLNEVVKSIDEDSWKFAGPRSQIHLVSHPGKFPWRAGGMGR